MLRWSTSPVALCLLLLLAFGGQALAQDKEGKEGGGGEQKVDEGKTPPPAGRQQPQGLEGLYPLFLMGGLIFFFYFLVMRPANRRMAQERENMLNNLDKNDVLLTIGGIYVSVVSVNKEVDEILVKIEEGGKMKITRSAIAQNITKEKEKQKEREAQKQQPAAATTEAKK